MSLIRGVILAISLFGMSAACLSQTTKPCKKCGGDGWNVCSESEHPSHRECGIKIKHTCSAKAKAKCCYGQERIPCPSCTNPSVQKEHKEVGARARKWRREMGKINRDTGVRFSHVQTKHVVVHCSFRKWRFPKIGSVKRERATHEFAARVEAMALEFEKHLGRLPRQPIEIFLCGNYEEMLAAARILAPERVKAIAPFRSSSQGTPRAFIFPSTKDLLTDKSMDSLLWHQSVHLFTQGACSKPYLLVPTWLDVGLAHWFEYKKLKGDAGCNNFCLEHYYKNPKWDNPKKWQKSITKKFNNKNAITFKKFASKPRESYDHQDHALSWSLIAAFIKKDPKGFKKFFEVWCKTLDMRGAIKVGFRMSLSEFNAQWHASCRGGKL